MKYVLWIVQVLLALLFLFAGGIKLVLPVEEMTAGSPLPGLLIQFIGVCEVLGAFGLLLPVITRIRPGLTPLAAAGLTVIMVGATVLTALGMGGEGVDPSMAAIPLVVGLLSAFVAYGRWYLVPQGARARDEVYAAAR